MSSYPLSSASSLAHSPSKSLSSSPGRFLSLAASSLSLPLTSKGTASPSIPTLGSISRLPTSR
ncbi:hypothetical protein Syun_001658 [Stephania yunnanensis]|uniref:Uncharacterized protein n=1 Tax=Stephania yunnanensis TaxID=152371 RepID=A0AAP0LF85_9MAGN